MTSAERAYVLELINTMHEEIMSLVKAAVLEDSAVMQMYVNSYIDAYSKAIKSLLEDAE